MRPLSAGIASAETCCYYSATDGTTPVGGHLKGGPKPTPYVSCSQAAPEVHQNIGLQAVAAALVGLVLFWALMVSVSQGAALMNPLHRSLHAMPPRGLPAKHTTAPHAGPALRAHVFRDHSFARAAVVPPSLTPSAEASASPHRSDRSVGPAPPLARSHRDPQRPQSNSRARWRADGETGRGLARVAALIGAVAALCYGVWRSEGRWKALQHRHATMAVLPVTGLYTMYPRRRGACGTLVAIVLFVPRQTLRLAVYLVKLVLRGVLWAAKTAVMLPFWILKKVLELLKAVVLLPKHLLGAVTSVAWLVVCLALWVAVWKYLTTGSPI